MKKIIYLVLITVFTVQCGNKKSDLVFEHWLTGTYQSNSSEGKVVESWRHPANSNWIGKQKVFLENKEISEQEFKIFKKEGDLFLKLVYEGNPYELPAIKTDMNGFEFGIDTENDGPHRVKFEKTGDHAFRRVHYVNINGRNRINMYDFSKIKE